MKKRFKNILAITGKKNGLAVLICAIIFIICMGTPVVCQIAKETVKDAARQPETMDLKTKDDLTENIRTDEPLPESGGDFQRAEQLSGDYAVSTGNMTVALYESKQDITDRLNETGLNYNEYDSDTKYSDPAYNKYDSYYMAGESPLGTNEAQDASLCIYFADGICVRLELLNGEAKTARGMRKGDSWSGVTEKYGDSFETHTYAAHGVYNVYRYSGNDCVCEFSIPEDDPDSVQSIDIYVPELNPVYDYGEELTD